MESDDVAFVQSRKQQLTHALPAVQYRFQFGQRMEHGLFRTIDEVHAAEAVLGFGEEDLPDIHYLMPPCCLQDYEQAGAGFRGRHRVLIRSPAPTVGLAAN